MSDNLQDIITFSIIALAVAYTVYTIIRMFSNQKDESCSSHGCPSCGVKHDLTKAHQKKINAKKIQVDQNRRS
jgi:hypothetical protein